jgi:hypothetical protein
MTQIAEPTEQMERILEKIKKNGIKLIWEEVEDTKEEKEELKPIVSEDDFLDIFERYVDQTILEKQEKEK